MTPSEPTISVVIPAYNCQETIAKCLDSLCRLDHQSFEVIVVDDGSIDGTPEICESYDGIRVIRLNNGGPSRARNVGVAAARGSLIAFTDADCLVDRKWLRELEKHFTGPDVAGVGGDQRSPDDESEFGRQVQDIFQFLGIVTYYIKRKTLVAETEHNPSCNSSYRKTVLEEVGGFDERLWPGEDVDLDIRIERRGYRLIYNPQAVVRHYRPSTYGGFARMMRRYGASAWYLFLRYGFFRILNYEPLATVLGLFLAAAVIVWEPLTWPLLLLPLISCFIWFFLKARKFRTAIQLTVLLMVILLCWNWGFFTGFSHPKRA